MLVVQHAHWMVVARDPRQLLAAAQYASTTTSSPHPQPNPCGIVFQIAVHAPVMGSAATAKGPSCWMFRGSFRHWTTTNTHAPADRGPAGGGHGAGGQSPGAPTEAVPVTV